MLSRISSGLYYCREKNVLIRTAANTTDKNNKIHTEEYIEKLIECCLRSEPSYGFPNNLQAKNPIMARKLELLLTNRCNLACKYCYSSNDRSSATMSFSIAKKSLDICINAVLLKYYINKNEKQLMISYHGGGEPTLAFDLLKKISDYAEYKCSQYGINLTQHITTNATLSITALKILVRKKIEFTISMDGDAAVQNMQRPYRNGNGSYSVVEKTLDTLEISGAVFEIRITVTAKALKTLEQFTMTICERWPHVQNVRFAPIIMTDEAIKNDVEEPYIEEYLTKVKKCKEILRARKAQYRFPVDITRLSQQNGLCASVRLEQMVVATDGTLIICHEDVDSEMMKYGKITLDGVKIDNAMIEKIKKRNISSAEHECSKCHIALLCLGGCMKRRLSRSKENYCSAERAEFNEIFEYIAKCMDAMYEKSERLKGKCNAPIAWMIKLPESECMKRTTHMISIKELSEVQ